MPNNEEWAASQSGHWNYKDNYRFDPAVGPPGAEHKLKELMAEAQANKGEVSHDTVMNEKEELSSQLLKICKITEKELDEYDDEAVFQRLHALNAEIIASRALLKKMGFPSE